jgi:hypothetical protein
MTKLLELALGARSENKLSDLEAERSALQNKLERAENNYLNCGCKIYAEESAALRYRINEIDKKLGNG